MTTRRLKGGWVEQWFWALCHCCPQPCICARYGIILTSLSSARSFQESNITVYEQVREPHQQSLFELCLIEC